MKRRDVIASIGAAATWPAAARAQQAAMPVIGWLNGGSAEGFAPALAAFREGLSETGFVEGRNVAIEYRWAEGRFDRLPAMATELAGRPVSVIVATAGGAGPAKAATATIPIVFSVNSDPVASGLVASLSRPGGNLTGASLIGGSLGPKRLELLRELVPDAALIAVLLNPTLPSSLLNPTISNAEIQSRELQAAAGSLGRTLHLLHASTDDELDAAFAALVPLRAGALIVSSDVFFNSRRERLVALAARQAIPAIYEWREFVAAGGLMSYGPRITEGYRQIGVYTGRILKGARPADLPVLQSAKVELAINLKTAKTLGLTLPLSLLGRADEVIE